KTESRYKNKLTAESCFHLHKILDSVYLEETHPDLAQFFNPNYALRPISTTFTATISNGAEYQNPGY
uniref:hypothetical protein n=1 Tax=uncultured Phocaeicola sp. TaxID=990718 RepID=UPI002592AF63